MLVKHLAGQIPWLAPLVAMPGWADEVSVPPLVSGEQVGCEGEARSPVVLVHGIYDVAGTMRGLARQLREEGHPTLVLELRPADGKMRLDELAEQAAEQIGKALPEGQAFHLLGFSMGGLVCRQLLQEDGGLRGRALSFTTLSTPHSGTWTAYLGWTPGVRQMRPGSDFLRQLEEGDAVLAKDGVSLLSLWTPYDLIILPATSSRWEGAEERSLGVLAHPLMLWDRRVAREVAGHLDEVEVGR
jgi:triacylglycerol lipase